MLYDRISWKKERTQDHLVDAEGLISIAAYGVRSFSGYIRTQTCWGNDEALKGRWKSAATRTHIANQDSPYDGIECGESIKIKNCPIKGGVSKKVPEVRIVV